jgi:NTP pyrophosphatase (non-canonical NTP hydrolase)
MLVVTELSEAVEHYRNGHGMTEVWYEADGKPDGIPVELADAMIRIMHIAEYYGMDLGREVKEKLAYNRTRDFRHGNKEA